MRIPLVKAHARWLMAVVTGAALLAVTQVRREWNFDVIPYGAVALRWAGHDAGSAHRLVYEQVAAAAPEKDAQALVASSAYRKELAADASKLESQLRMYSNKPLFCALLSVLARLGVNVIEAAFWLSALAFALLGSFVVMALGGGVRALGVLLLLTPPFLEAGLIASPDSLAALGLFAGGWALLEDRHAGWIAAGFLLAVTARPDAAMLAVALLLWRRHLALAAVVGALTALTQALVSPPSWEALFVHTFVRRLTSEADFAGAHVEAAAWLEALRKGLRAEYVLHPSLWPAFAVGSVVLAWKRVDARTALLVLWLVFVARVLVFPLVTDRFFLGTWALMLFLALRTQQPAVADSRAHG